jgi:hypothetical protein
MLIGIGLMMGALPVHSQGSTDELQQWQQHLSEEILTGGNTAIETMLEDSRKQLRYRLRQEQRSTLRRLGRRLQLRGQRYTTEPADDGPELVQTPLPGPRSAAVIENGSVFMGDIR